MRLTRSSLLLLLAACVVDSEPRGNRCDDTHACKSGQLCVVGECVDETGVGGGTAGTAGGGGSSGGGTAGDGGGVAGGSTAGSGMSDGGFNVLYIDPSGNDSNPGTSPDQAWATLGKLAAANLSPGTVVRLKGGAVFREQLNATFSGTVDSPIVIESYGTGKAAIDGSNATGGATGYGIGVSNRGFLVFRDLEVRSWPDGFCVYLLGTTDIRFERVELHDCVEGVHPSGQGRCDGITVVDSSIHHLRGTPAFTNPFAINIPASCSRVMVADSGLSFAEKNCVTDNSPRALYQHLDIHDCGSAGIQLRNSGSTIRDVRIANTVASCIELQTDGGITIEGSQLSGCTNGVRTDINATGRIDVRKNRIWDVSFGVTMTTGAVIDLRISNNSVLGGKADGGPTQWAFDARRGGTLALENNLATGAFFSVLSVSGVDGGTLADGGRFVPGFVERANVFDTSQSQLLWDRAVTPAEYLMISGQGGATSFSDPGLASTSLSSPDFHLSSTTVLRDRGVTDPATGALSYGCDGGIATFCGVAPEPGALELIP